MINVSLKNKLNLICFLCEGHSEEKELCNAVSFLCKNLELGYREIRKENLKVEYKKNGEFLLKFLLENINNKEKIQADFLYKNLTVSLLWLKAKYKNEIKIVRGELNGS